VPTRRWHLTVAILSAAAILAAVAGAGAALLARGSHSPGVASSSIRTTSPPTSPASAGTRTGTPAATTPATTGSYPSATASFALFTGGWGRSGGGYIIQPDGNFTVSLRTYTWCTNNPPPCDSISNNNIIAGDTAAGHLISASGDVATGVVTQTTDSQQTPVGTIFFTLDPSTDIMSVSDGGDFCGPKAAAGACGA
jgi:hypothetical protein